MRSTPRFRQEHHRSGYALSVERRSRDDRPRRLTQALDPRGDDPRLDDGVPGRDRRQRRAPRDSAKTPRTPVPRSVGRRGVSALHFRAAAPGGLARLQERFRGSAGRSSFQAASRSSRQTFPRESAGARSGPGRERRRSRPRSGRSREDFLSTRSRGARFST